MNMHLLYKQQAYHDDRTIVANVLYRLKHVKDPKLTIIVH
jgi:hypothetical protein